MKVRRRSWSSNGAELYYKLLPQWNWTVAPNAPGYAKKSSSTWSEHRKHSLPARLAQTPTCIQSKWDRTTYLLSSYFACFMPNCNTNDLWCSGVQRHLFGHDRSIFCFVECTGKIVIP